MIFTTNSEITPFANQERPISEVSGTGPEKVCMEIASNLIRLANSTESPSNNLKKGSTLELQTILSTQLTLNLDPALLLDTTTNSTNNMTAIEVSSHGPTGKSTEHSSTVSTCNIF